MEKIVLEKNDMKYEGIIFEPSQSGGKPLIQFSEWLQVRYGCDSLNDIRERAKGERWGKGEADELCNNLCKEFREFASKYNLNTLT